MKKPAIEFLKASSIALLLLFGLFAAATARSQERLRPGIVSKIVDGDTIRLRADAPKELKIRLISIDAPEVHVQTPGGETVGQGYWGDASTQHLEILIATGTRVFLQEFGQDAYRRILGRIYTSDGDVNYEMVRIGWAIPYFICEGPSCNEEFFERHDVRMYLDACHEARRQGSGIFDPAMPLKEMPFEFRLRVMGRTPDKYVANMKTRLLYPPDEYKAVDLCERIFFYKAEDARRLGFRDRPDFFFILHGIKLRIPNSIPAP